jgi:hypothetical protein
MPLSSPSALDAYASSYRDPFAAVTFPGGDRVAEIRHGRIESRLRVVGRGRLPLISTSRIRPRPASEQEDPSM